MPTEVSHWRSSYYSILATWTEFLREVAETDPSGPYRVLHVFNSYALGDIDQASALREIESVEEGTVDTNDVAGGLCSMDKFCP